MSNNLTEMMKKWKGFDKYNSFMLFLEVVIFEDGGFAIFLRRFFCKRTPYFCNFAQFHPSHRRNPNDRRKCPNCRHILHLRIWIEWLCKCLRSKVYLGMPFRHCCPHNSVRRRNWDLRRCKHRSHSGKLGGYSWRTENGKALPSRPNDRCSRPYHHIFCPDRCIDRCCT